MFQSGAQIRDPRSLDHRLVSTVILGGVKKSIKISLAIIAPALLACLVCIIWLGSRPDELNETVAQSVFNTSRGPSFEVRVITPRVGRPFGGILPDWFVKKLDGTPREIRSDHTSRGTHFGRIEPNHVELRADEWELSIETDSEGHIAPGTYLVFPLALGGRKLRLKCQPADRATGYLRTATRPDSNGLGGRFAIEFASCTNAESGKAINWPPGALTVRGSFVGPGTLSLEPKSDRPKT